MPGKRTTMRKLRDVLRLRHAAGLSIRDISRSTKLSVGGHPEAAQPGPRALHLSWPLPADLDDTRFSRSSSRIRSRSVLVRPARLPWSTFARLTHLRKVSAVQPILSAMEVSAGSLGVIVLLVLQHQPHGPFPDFRGITFVSVHYSILSRNGVSSKPGAVQ